MTAPAIEPLPGEVEVVFNADGTQARFAEGTHGHVILIGRSRTWLQTFVRDVSQNQQTVRISGVEPGSVEVLLSTFDAQARLVGHARAPQVQVSPGAVTQVLGSDLTGLGPSAGIDFNHMSTDDIEVTVNNQTLPTIDFRPGLAFGLAIFTSDSITWQVQANQPDGFSPVVTLGVVPEGASELSPYAGLEPGVTYYVSVFNFGGSGSTSFVYGQDATSNR